MSGPYRTAAEECYAQLDERYRQLLPHDPIVRACYELGRRRGECREETLLRTVVELAARNRELTGDVIDLMNQLGPAPIRVPEDSERRRDGG